MEEVALIRPARSSGEWKHHKMCQQIHPEDEPWCYAGVEAASDAEQLLRDLVDASDDGADTYEVQGIVERAAQLLGLPSRSERRQA
jgi:hypothetical protein